MSTTIMPELEALETVVPVTEPASLLGSLTGDLVLRMSNGPHAGRIVRLSAAKCSIGSAADCTLRLRGAGLDPVHCVILRGARQTIVRRWSTDTRLNDRRFDDQALRNGDRLSVGSIEMQVVSVPGEVREAAQAVRRLDVELAASTARMERLTQRLDLANRQGRRRLRSVLAKLRKYQLRLTEVEIRRSRLTQEHESLAAERAQLASAHETLERRRGELEQEVRRLTENAAAASLQKTELERRAALLAEREAEWTARSREMADRKAATATEMSQLQAAQAELELRLSESASQSRRLALQDAETAARRVELDRQATTLTEQAAAISVREQAVERRASQLADGERLLTDRQAGLAKQVAELSKQAADLTDRETEVASRCEALKNHWTVLTERETKLERDRTALAAREQALSEKPAAASAEPTVIVDSTAVERAAELQRALELARADLAAMQAEQTRREASLLEAQAVQDTDLAERRAALDAETADLLQRRQTVELAARTLSRWAELVEEWNAAESASAVAAAPAAVDAPSIAAEVSESHAWEDRLQIEKLEAELKTWRDEAKLWKSRYDETNFGPTKADEPTATEHSENEIETVAERAEAPATHESMVADEPVAEEESLTEEAGTDEAVTEEAYEEATEQEPEVAAESEAPAVEAKQESAAEVLRRLGLTAALEEEAAPAAATPIRMPTPPPPAPAPQPVTAEAHHEGEESLDAYMQQLFQRLGVNQGTQPAPAAKPQPSQVAAKVEEAPQAEKPAAAPAPLPLLQPGEFKARSSAAERRSDLSALRELANFQAKTAITKHQITRKSTNSKSKLTIATLSLGLGLYGCWSYFIDGNDVAKFGMGAGLGVGVLYVLQSLGLNLQAKKSARSLDDVIQKTAARSATPEPAAK